MGIEKYRALIATLWIVTSLFLSVEGVTQSFDENRLWQEVRDAESLKDHVKKTVALDQLVRRFNEPLAMYNLGMSYKSGEGVPRDVPMAVMLWQRSIQFGYERLEFGSDELNLAYRGSAAVTLGFTYLVGAQPELQPDARLALEWNLRGARLGHTNAYSNLALVYAMGFGVDRNYSTTVTYLIKSVESYTDHHAWLLRKSDEWKDMVKDAPPEVWKARQLYWTALRTGDKQSSIREMRELQARLKGLGAPAAKRPITGENIVKKCLSRGLKPGTQRFSECIAGN